MNDVKSSTECLIENITIDKIPVKLYCAYKSAQDSIDSLTKAFAAKGVPLVNNKLVNPAQAAKVYDPATENREQASAAPTEGDAVDAPADLPVFDTSSDSAKLQQSSFERKADPSIHIVETVQDVELVENSMEPTKKDLSS